MAIFLQVYAVINPEISLYESKLNLKFDSVEAQSNFIGPPLAREYTVYSPILPLEKLYTL